MAKAKGFAVQDKGIKTPQKKSGGASPVKFTRDELNILLPQYYLIRDCLAGEPAIKGYIGLQTTLANVGAGGAYNGGGTDPSNMLVSRARRYLPMPNARDQSSENIERYKSYVQRAVWYGVTAHTLDGMIGQIYLIDPVVKLPKQLSDVMLKDADGQGLSLVQLTKRASRNTVGYGRAGLLADYPPTTGATTKAQLEAGDIRPILTVYSPWNIINWRTKKRGVKTVLSLVVLQESLNDLADDGFAIEVQEKYRVLRLENINGIDQYTVETYVFDGDNDSQGANEKFTPTDSKGKPFDTIPFTFIGSENNDEAVDKPPMYDIASLNIAHYRNSADYEESAYMCGQPTAVAIGVSEQWLTDVLKGSITLGSRGGIALPVGASVELIQASPNNLPGEAMKLKEEQMVSLGAKLIMPGRVSKTATEKISDTSSEQSILTNVANNVSAAFEFALGFCARFIGEDATNIKLTLNTSFELNKMTLDDVSKLIAVWQKGGIAFVEMRDGVRKAGLAHLSDEDAMKAIENEVAMGLATGPVADPFGQIEKAAAAAASGPEPSANPNPRSDPAGHATNPKTRSSAG